MTLGCATLLALLAGCVSTPSLQMKLPDDFLQLESPRNRGLRATTADDARLWVRNFNVQADGSQKFWADAVLNDLVESRGYELVSSDVIQDAEGESGTAMEFTTVADGERVGYLMAVFWRGGGKIRVAEFTAPQARFDELSDGVRAAITTLR